jgi:4-alpha-glucanotransferase
MRILHYAFGEGDDNRHLPHHHPRRCLAYPGNHDNDTTLGWWSRLDRHARAHAQRYLDAAGKEIAWAVNDAALSSRADVAVLQMQDVLALPGEARMNDPTAYTRGEAHLNWSWRLLPGQASPEVAERLRARSDATGRTSARAA